MSRTYRRKKQRTYRGYGFQTLNWATSKLVRIEGTCRFVRVPIDPGSQEYKERVAKYYSDAGTTDFKEPGPSWFRNLFTERPLRRYNKEELRRYLQNPDYEPMVEEKGKLEYWT